MAGEYDVMNSPDFGAFGGAKFAQESQLRSLQALHTAGEINAQPSAMALQAAHARFFNAEAARQETLTAQQALMAKLAPGVFTGAQGGTTAASPSSLADPFAALARAAGSVGAVDLAGKYAETAGTVALKEQEVATSRANMQLHQLDAHQKTLEQSGALAYFMAQSPENYAQGRMALQAQGKDISDMPADFASAKPQLDMLAAQSVKAKDQLDQIRKAAVSKAEITKFNAQAGAASAAAAASGSRKDVLDQTYDFRLKNEGDASSAIHDLRIARKKAADASTAAQATKIEAQANARAAIDRAKFPPPTPQQIADPTKLRVGQSYSTPKGVLTWTGKGWVPMRQVAPAPASAALASPAEEDLGEED